MSGSLAYHRRLDDGTVLSLQFAHPDRKRVVAKEQTLRQESDETQRFESRIQAQTLNQRIYTLYTAELYPHEFPDEDIESLSQRDSLIVDTLLEGV